MCCGVVILFSLPWLPSKQKPVEKLLVLFNPYLDRFFVFPVCSFAFAVSSFFDSQVDQRKRGKKTIIKPCQEQSASRKLVDLASDHMLVSKIKLCTSQYKWLCHSETAWGSINQLISLCELLREERRRFVALVLFSIIWISVVILELIHAPTNRSSEGPSRIRFRGKAFFASCIC